MNQLVKAYFKGKSARQALTSSKSTLEKCGKIVIFTFNKDYKVFTSINFKIFQLLLSLI